MMIIAQRKFSVSWTTKLLANYLLMAQFVFSNHISKYIWKYLNYFDSISSVGV